MLIKIDNREHELIRVCSQIIGNIENTSIYKGIKIVIETLPIGDIILCDDDTSEKIIIERKSLADLSASIKDGRYAEQSYRLNGSLIHNHNIIYLIEGDLSKKTSNIFKENMDKTTLYSAMFSLNYYKGFSVLRSINTEESALIICNMAYKLNKSLKKNSFYSNSSSVNIFKNIESLEPTEDSIKESNDAKDDELKDESNNNDEKNKLSPEPYCSVIKKIKKENITPENIDEIMLCQIPGISSVSAIAIIKEFQTIHNLISKVINDKSCLNNISYINEKGKSRKINKGVISNIIKYLVKV